MCIASDSSWDTRTDQTLTVVPAVWDSISGHTHVISTNMMNLRKGITSVSRTLFGISVERTSVCNGMVISSC
jgi:hypothetical protein